MAEAAWDRQRTVAEGPPIRYKGAGGEKRKFVLEAGRKYKRHAPARDRQALEELILRQLRAARGQAGAATKDGGSTLPVQ